MFSAVYTTMISTYLLCVVVCLPVLVLSRQGHLQHFGEQGIKIPIEEVDGFVPPLKFYKDYVVTKKPVLMKNAFKSPAMTKWTDEYLMQSVQPRPKGDVLVELHKKQPLKQNVTYMHFKEFLETYNKSDYYVIDFVPDSIKKDVILFYPVQCKSFVLGGLNTNIMWFSSGGTRGIIHQDPYQNMLCQMRGHKHFVFLDLGKYEWIRPLVLDHPGHSSIDVDKLDLNRWPFMEGLEYIHADVNPGDCIFIPLHVPHQVRSYGESNLAVSLWYFDSKVREPTGCLSKENKNLTFDKVFWMENVNRSKVESKNLIFTFWKMGMTDRNMVPPILAMGNEFLTNKKSFVDVCLELFDASDVVRDGKIDAADDAKNLTVSELRRLVRALENYNKVVFAIRERPVKGYLPKYFFQFEGKVFGYQETVYGYLHYKYDVGAEEMNDQEEYDDDDTFDSYVTENVLLKKPANDDVQKKEQKKEDSKKADESPNKEEL